MAAALPVEGPLGYDADDFGTEDLVVLEQLHLLQSRGQCAEGEE